MVSHLSVAASACSASIATAAVGLWLCITVVICIMIVKDIDQEHDLCLNLKRLVQLRGRALCCFVGQRMQTHQCF